MIAAEPRIALNHAYIKFRPVMLERKRNEATCQPSANNGEVTIRLAPHGSSPSASWV